MIAATSSRATIVMTAPVTDCASGINDNVILLQFDCYFCPSVLCSFLAGNISSGGFGLAHGFRLDPACINTLAYKIISDNPGSFHSEFLLKSGVPTVGMP